MKLQELSREAFAPGGVLSRAAEDFRRRPGQTEMALAVARAIESGGPLVVEAGTGVGKTFSYLVPALLSGERVLLSTATKTLQDQLFGRDLPRQQSHHAADVARREIFHDGGRERLDRFPSLTAVFFRSFVIPGDGGGRGRGDARDVRTLPGETCSERPGIDIDPFRGAEEGQRGRQRRWDRRSGQRDRAGDVIVQLPRQHVPDDSVLKLLQADRVVLKWRRRHGGPQEQS